MSDNWLKFVPTDPYWQPPADAAKAASDLLSSFVPEADEIRTEFSDECGFIDPGGNFESVNCPVCKAEVMQWWIDAIDAAARENFRNLETVVPCCGTEVSLNDLHYDWPAAFGRFVLEAMNPNVRDTTPEQDRVLADRIGHPLRKVWVHI
jgi:hypothetical protein